VGVSSLIALGRQRTLRVLETTALGQHRTIHLVAVGRRTLLLASAANQITVLADVSGEQQARPAETSSVKPGFSTVLNQLLGCNPPVQTGYVERLRAAAAALRAEGASGRQQ